MHKGVLKEIIGAKSLRISEAKRALPLPVIRERLRGLPPRAGGFGEALIRGKGISIIGEIKKRSPSAGIIRPDFNAGALAAEYDNSGVSAISVLTEQDFFGGSIQDLQDAVRATSKPVLQKDFFIDEYQVCLGRLLGADCILLIAGVLGGTRLEKFLKLAADMGVECLVEVHDAEETAMALDAGAGIIGVNNRNLDTLEVDLGTSGKIAARIPRGVLKVSESGVKTREDMKYLESAGFDAVLVGETLMKEGDISSKVKELMLS